MKKIILVTLIIVSIYFILNIVFWGSTPYPMMMHHYPYYTQNNIDWIWNIAIIIIAGIALVVSTIMLLPRKSDIKDILDQRLSKGEITIDEYKKIKRIINS